MKRFSLSEKSPLCLGCLLVILCLAPQIFAQCQADFYAIPKEGTAPLLVTFYDNSTGAYAWSWSFPGGSPPTGSGNGPITVTYAQPGTYDVTLKIACQNGNDTRTRTGYIEVNELVIRYDYGDAPEDVIAYPDLGVIGRFPTCLVGSAGFIRHTEEGRTFLGHHADYEREGNGDFCPSFIPDMYDMDEQCGEGESCLWKPDVFTIVDGSVVPLCSDMSGDHMGYPCSLARWGDNINIWFDTWEIDGAYVNVIIDWNQDGQWGGASSCDNVSIPEHILQNFHVPGAMNGHLSVLDPPAFRIGPNSGYVWARFTITNEPIPLPWDGGGGTFHAGETEDHLLKVGDLSELFDYGDAPASYSTLASDNGAYHIIMDGVYLGHAVSGDDDGKPSDKADGDDDDGVTFPEPVVAGKPTPVHVLASVNGKLKIWFDWNHDGDFDDEGEEVFDDEVPEGENDLDIDVPEYAREGETYARFRFSGGSILTPHGPVMGGEIEDYVVVVELEFEYEFGDAPEGKTAYLAEFVEMSDTDVEGSFMTCGDYGRVRHGNRGERYFGNSVDFETEGNAGCCSCGYDQDETIWDDDAGLTDGHVYTIVGDPGAEHVEYVGGSGLQMVSCEIGRWGRHLDIMYHCTAEEGAYINVLVDWNQSGGWNNGGAIYHCMDPGAPHIQEHIVQDLYVPQGWGFLSDAGAPDFRMGGPGGYVWARFTISDTPVGTDEWNGHGDFADGETEDYLLHVARAEYRDYGDAPSGDIAYPSSGVVGNFPTCPVSGSHTIRHGSDDHEFAIWFGGGGAPPTTEPSGNRGMCRGAYNLDDDNGLLYTVSYNIVREDGHLRVVPLYEGPEGGCSGSEWSNTIGTTTQMADWCGCNFDLAWSNQYWDDWAYVNVIIDWDQDGEWGGSSFIDIHASAPEHVLQNYRIPPARGGSGLGAHPYERPPGYRIGPNAGYVWARFTITPEPVPLPWDGSGDFEDGETEDYLLKVAPGSLTSMFDFGDSWILETLANQSGAMHTIVAGFHLGDLIDGDGDGQSNEGSTGDDDDGTDDDDGVEFVNSLNAGSAGQIVVTASAAGILSAWMDFNRNGSWDDEEDQIIEDEPLDEGANQLSFPIPGTAAPGTTYVRFRFSDQGGLGPSGPHYTDDPFDNPDDLPPIGEVEDYAVVIEGGTGNYDFGDAPDPYYSTLAVHFGAWHYIDGSLWMGNTVDAETDGLPDADAKGDDANGTDDEDGVVFHNTWTAGVPASFTVTLSDSAYLNVWADFNGNGDWNDPNEHIVDDDFFGPGSKLYDILIPDTVYLDSTYVRFRASRIPDLTPTGYAPDGEVEDYYIQGISTEIQERPQSGMAPEVFELKQNRPNPFNPTTQIQYAVPRQSHVRIMLFNTRGQLVRTLMNEEKTAGRYVVQWDGRNEQGAMLPTGVYIYTIQAGSFFDAKKLLLLK
ncbi:PKD domain-containing protein [bacterium]|nr:PKD domain-containing protein [bacterium]